MAFNLPELPFAKNALEPHMSAQTFDFHHGKHHNTYVVNLNKLVEGTEFENMALEEIVQKTAGDSAKAGIFNNAAQVWNHTFFWHSLSPNGGGAPSGELANRIASDFGSLDQFKEDFKNAGATQFGSGWAWLVEEAGQLRIVKTPNAETPITKGQKPLLCVDVWEHAYYLDFQNRRPDFIDSFLNNLVNWDFAAQNLSSGEMFKVAA
jgi:Fe-Mn family superoxide dismutase